MLSTAICARDTPDCDRLVKCFHPDARVTTSWFDGTAREFAAQSKRMMEDHHPSDTQRHMIHTPLNGLPEEQAARKDVEAWLAAG